MVEVFIMRLHGRRLSERLMRPIGVAEALEFGQLDVGRADAELAGAGLVELVSAGGVGALHAAVMLRAFGRQREQRDAAPLAGWSRTRPRTRCRRRPAPTRRGTAPGGSDGRGMPRRRWRWLASRRACSKASRPGRQPRTPRPRSRCRWRCPHGRSAPSGRASARGRRSAGAWRGGRTCAAAWAFVRP